MVAERGLRPVARRIAGSGAWRGMGLVLRSPYLAGMAGFILLSAVVATIFYYQLNGLAGEQLPTELARRAMYADINLWQNVLSLAIQLTLTTPILLRLGLSAALCAMPMVSLMGLCALAIHPVVGLLAVIETLRRTMQFAVDKPAREVLYTPLGLEEKYKSKTFIDTAVLRLGDLAGAGLSDRLLAWGVARDALTAMAAPAFLVWALLGWWLGRQCHRRERDVPAVPPS
jgi:AAA family ATP:ADP antiporter